VQGPRRRAELGGADPGGADRRDRGPAGHGLRGDAGLTGSPGNVLVDRLFRRESGQAVALLARILGDLDRAEEAVQDAFVTALERWPRDGAPANPAAWIVTAARNRAIDRIRRERRWAGRQAALETELRALGGDDEEESLVSPIPDERLRLIFTVCHPALAPEARVGLTLRALGGLTTAEVARAFLVSESAMAQRIVRAKQKIAAAGIKYEIPRDSDLPARLSSVLATVYLVFNAGYGPPVRRELCAEAIRLGRLLVALMPDEPEAIGLLALMLLQDSRRAARVDDEGRLVLLSDQDRSRWDREQIAEGERLVVRGWRLGRLGLYLCQASIAVEHARGSDWARIAWLYDQLLAISPTAIVRLNRAVAIAERDGPQAGLELMGGLGLEGYHLFHAARADLLRRLDRRAEAADAYRAALALTESEVEREFLARRLHNLQRPSD
jgi:RNA polymerase sigma-70 factor (ECF subfamily)